MVVATEKQQRCCGHLGNSPDELRHTRSVAYSVELVVLNKHQISGGGAYLDCYRHVDLKPTTDRVTLTLSISRLSAQIETSLPLSEAKFTGLRARSD